MPAARQSIVFMDMPGAGRSNGTCCQQRCATELHRAWWLASRMICMRIRAVRQPGTIPRNRTMTLHLELAPLLALIAGIAILVWPRLLSRIVAIYLIAVGAVGLFGL